MFENPRGEWDGLTKYRELIARAEKLAAQIPQELLEKAVNEALDKAIALELGKQGKTDIVELGKSLPDRAAKIAAPAAASTAPAASSTAPAASSTAPAASSTAPAASYVRAEKAVAEAVEGVGKRPGDNMKMTMQARPFEQALKSISHVATVDYGDHKVEHVKITVSNDEVVLSAVNGELFVSYSIPRQYSDISNSGTVAVSAVKLLQIIKGASNKISLSQEGTDLLVTTNIGKFKLPGEDVSRFVQRLAKGKRTVVENKTLRSLIKRTEFASTEYRTRYNLENIQVNVLDRKIKLVATDGSRLAICESEHGSHHKENISALINAKSMRRLNKILKLEKDTTVSLMMDAQRMTVATDQIIATIEVPVDAKFPNYERVIPTPTLKSDFHLVRKEFLAALKQAKGFSSKMERSAQFHFAPESLTIKSLIPEMGDMSIVLPIKFEGTPFEAGFNCDFLMEALNATKSDLIQIFAEDKDKPMSILDGDGFQYIVLPIREEKE